MEIANEPAFTSFERKGGRVQVIEKEARIVVGIGNDRTKLRVSILLNTIPEYHVQYISSDSEIGNIIDESDLIIGTGTIALEGILRRKPVIVVGDYGLGGLVTPDTFRIQYGNNFKGKINGLKDEYFSLEKLEGEIRKAFHLTCQELQMMSNQISTFLKYTDFLI